MVQVPPLNFFHGRSVVHSVYVVPEVVHDEFKVYHETIAQTCEYEEYLWSSVCIFIRPPLAVVNQRLNLLFKPQEFKNMIKNRRVPEYKICVPECITV